MEMRQIVELLETQPKTPGVREIVTAEEKRRIFELEKFRERLGKHRIVEIKLVDIQKDLTFDSLVSVLTYANWSEFHQLSGLP